VLLQHLVKGILKNLLLLTLSHFLFMEKQNKITNAFNKAINTKVINTLDIKTLRKLEKILSKIK